MVRLYGRLVGYASHAQVTRGFLDVLSAAGLLAGMYPLDQDPPPDTPPPGGATAPVALYTGPLGFLHLLVAAGKHARRLAMVAPNSNRLPAQLCASLHATCTDVLAPSWWAARVIEAQSLGLPVHVVPHGLAEAFEPSAERREAVRRGFGQGYFRVAHLATSERGRKGTVELVEAWALLVRDRRLPEKAQLDLVLDPAAYVRMQEYMLDRAGGAVPGVALYQRMDLAPAQMAGAFSHCHVICQPSRGEAFGLVPLEARACGVPIVVTTCTGHSEHTADGDPGVVVVPHGALAPIEDMSDSLAPSVTAEAIAAALWRAYEHWPDLDADAYAAADRVRFHWSWAAQLRGFVALVRGAVSA